MYHSRVQGGALHTGACPLLPSPRLSPAPSPVADIPGLIRDAHRNRGLGVSFLRHVQRCSCLLYVLDVTARPARQLEVLRHELDMFQAGLADRPHALVANKCDLPGAEVREWSLWGWGCVGGAVCSVRLISARAGHARLRRQCLRRRISVDMYSMYLYIPAAVA